MTTASTLTETFSVRVQFTPLPLLSNAPVSIRFNDGTLFVEIKDSVKQIPIELFGFRNHDQLLSLANTNKQISGNLF
ncbi:hypothetical protein Bca52824_015071 [Brassica carinata]|uniref:Uncharacterized protein n=1 Tax=Brassica carinata TaxID=52824 RepID=A0A8X7W0Y4_BRACI|nr:hypothetical protein Bca52824_015071 [Brassica carinata]